MCSVTSMTARPVSTWDPAGTGRTSRAAASPSVRLKPSKLGAVVLAHAAPFLFLLHVISSAFWHIHAAQSAWALEAVRQAAQRRSPHLIWINLRAAHCLRPPQPLN